MIVHDRNIAHICVTINWGISFAYRAAAQRHVDYTSVFVYTCVSVQHPYTIIVYVAVHIGRRLVYLKQ